MTEVPGRKLLSSTPRDQGEVLFVIDPKEGGDLGTAQSEEGGTGPTLRARSNGGDCLFGSPQPERKERLHIRITEDMNKHKERAIRVYSFPGAAEVNCHKPGG